PRRVRRAAPRSLRDQQNRKAPTGSSHRSQSVRVDSNHRRLDPQSSALTRLRYAPSHRTTVIAAFGGADGTRNAAECKRSPPPPPPAPPRSLRPPGSPRRPATTPPRPLHRRPRPARRAPSPPGSRSVPPPPPTDARAHPRLPPTRAPP